MAKSIEDTREILHRNVKKQAIVEELIDDELEIVETEGTKEPRIKFTGKTLDQQKMLKQKMLNCNNENWISLNKKAGSYPKQAYVTLRYL